MHITKERDFVIRKWSDFLNLDWYALFPTLALVFCSLVLLKSISAGGYLFKQFIFIFPALFIATFAISTRIDYWKKKAPLIYILNLLLLGFVLVKGNTAMGSQRWIALGPFNIQPSEIAKVALIITLSAWFSKREVKGYLDIILSALIILPPFLLVFKQPDLGTSLTFGAIYLGMVFWAGATLTHLLVLTSPALSLILNATGNIVVDIGIIKLNSKLIHLTLTNHFLIFLLFLAIWLIVNYKPWKSPWLVLLLSGIIFSNFFIGFIRPVLWSFLHPYQQRRLTIFLNPESDPLGAGYHIVQSLLAIGNGGFWGYGWLNGRLTRGSYVPAQHTDFIFSTVGEEFGFIGTSIILILFGVLLWRILFVAANSNDRFSSLMAVGIFSFFLFHIFVNIGMTIGIMPITGVPLPFLSYGGSALVVDMFCIFLVSSISWRTLPKRFF